MRERPGICCGARNSLVPGTRMVLVVLFILAALLICLGCGLETEEANKALEAAAKHQEQAQVILERIKNFPAEWEAMFNVPIVGADQINGAKQLIATREQDLAALEEELKEWGGYIESISSLNVEENIKEYVKMKMSSINCYTDYVTAHLRPILQKYNDLVDLIAAGRSTAETNQTAQEISKLVGESVSQLEECRDSEEQADKYFRENKLGK